MKGRTLVTMCLAALLATSCSKGDPVQYGAGSKDELLLALERAARERSMDRFLSLTCWPRLPSSLKDRFRATTPGFMTKQLESVRFDDAKEDHLAKQREYKWNVNFLGYIEMKYQGDEEPLELPYGEFQGRYYLATTVRADREF